MEIFWEFFFEVKVEIEVENVIENSCILKKSILLKSLTHVTH